MKNNVYIQEKFIEIIESNNTGEALRIVGEKLQSGEYIYDPLLPKSVKLEYQE